MLLSSFDQRNGVPCSFLLVTSWRTCQWAPTTGFFLDKNGRGRRSSRAHGGPCPGGEMLVCRRRKLHGSAPRVDRAHQHLRNSSSRLTFAFASPSQKLFSLLPTELREGKNTDQILPPKKGGKKKFNCARVCPVASCPSRNPALSGSDFVSTNSVVYRPSQQIQYLSF
jgi:hypothetical protein